MLVLSIDNALLLIHATELLLEFIFYLWHQTPQAMQIFKGQATQIKTQYCPTNPRRPVKDSMLYTVYISGRLICDILETGNTALPFPEALRSFIVELLRSLIALSINIDTWNLKVSLQTNSRPLADTFITPSRRYKARPIEELLCSKVCTEPTWQCAPL